MIHKDWQLKSFETSPEQLWDLETVIYYKNKDVESWIGAMEDPWPTYTEEIKMFDSILNAPQITPGIYSKPFSQPAENNMFITFQNTEQRSRIWKHVRVSFCPGSRYENMVADDNLGIHLRRQYLCSKCFVTHHCYHILLRLPCVVTPFELLQLYLTPFAGVIIFTWKNTWIWIWIWTIFLIQVRLRTEILRTPSSTQPGFELMASKSWQ